MAQVGVLGYLKYDSAAHSWVLDLGARISSLENSMDSTLPGRRDDAIDAIDDINGALKSHKIEYAIPNITTGANPDPRTVLSDILDLVEKKDRTLGAFLLIGAAANFLEIAAVTRGPEKVAELQNRARKRVDNIPRRNEGINVSAGPLYDLLAQPPHGAQELRTKLKRAGQPLVILFLAANPGGTLDLSNERNTLGKIVQSAVVHNAFRVEDVPGCRISDITDALRRYQPTLLHFSGHGTEEGEFLFHGEGGEVEKVKAGALAKVLALAHKKGLQGAVMNACYGDTDAQLLANATGYAVAMKGLLSDPDASKFSREFYGALGSGEMFEDAFEWAVAGTGIDPQISVLRPKLFKKQEGAHE
jgi:hypothetical protein